jgi:2-polyprenyl-3-methyl-5-hydroxy-6-metoxy-1,4-benzoquinol methylase
MDYKDQYKNKNKSYYDNNRTELEAFIPHNIKTALDVGCGSGFWGEFLKRSRHCIVWGIEPNETAAKAASKKLDKVINGLFSNEMPELATQKFDVIFFNDVLEHLVDPEKALSYCKGFLNPGGVVIASIPNIRFYTVLNDLIFKRDFEYTESGIMDKTHLRFFTKNSIVRMVETAGFKIELIQGINLQPVKGRKIKLLKLLFGKWLSDINVLQYAVVASPV